jgi:hypothetical protein
MKWQVFNSAWCWSLLRKGETIKKSMETVGYNNSAINKVLTKVDVDLRNAENKKYTKPSFWKSNYDNDYNKLQLKVDQFWSDKNSPKNIPGLCIAIGCVRRTMMDSLLDERIPSEIIAILKRELLHLEAYQLDKIQESPAGGIFNLKNNHGYKDKREVVNDNTFKVASMDDQLMAHSRKILERCELELKAEDIEDQ